MIKKAYQKPTMNVVVIQQQAHILAGSINTKLQSSEVESAWSRGGNRWEDEEED